MFNFQQFIIILCIALISACGGKSTVKTGAGKVSPAQKSGTEAKSSGGKGGYYLDDGPGDNAPANIDGIPDAEPKTEVPLVSANKPYSALGQKYIPMTTYAPYSERGIASWYGKRYHGKKTSSGETYDMYAMSGAHTTLPIPSYVKVTNPANKRSVIVRINDRGPFKHERLIDLSYAAAYKLRLTSQGSGLVEVEWIDTSAEAMQKKANTQIADNNTPVAETADIKETAVVTYAAPAVTAPPQAVTKNSSDTKNNTEIGSATYYVQVGAFRSETNGDQLQKKIMGLDLAGDAAVTNVYNDGIYRVKLGPFGTRKEADISAGKVRKQLNISAIVTNQ